MIYCADEPVNSEESDVYLPEESKLVVVPLQFEQFSREFEVKFYTSLPSTKYFKCLFDFLLEKAQRMQYWHKADAEDNAACNNRFSDVCCD